jgi:hypothetical protein
VFNVRAAAFTSASDARISVIVEQPVRPSVTINKNVNKVELNFFLNE